MWVCYRLFSLVTSPYFYLTETFNMGDYDRVIDKLQEHNLSWREIDRILLNEDTYEELQRRASFDVTDHYTADTPAVRETTGQEKIVYVNKQGMEIIIEL